MITQDVPAPGLPLEPTICPLCGADEGEPVAVGADFDFGTAPDGFLALACVCGLVYLNPAPAPSARARIYPPAYFAAWRTDPGRRRDARAAARRAIACCRGLSADARLLVSGLGGCLPLEELRAAAPPGWRFEAASPHTTGIEAGRSAGFIVHAGAADDLDPAAPEYDAILLLHALEHADEPLRELRSLRARVRAGGRIVIVCPNAASAVGQRFRGRHWMGYDFPRHRVLFTPATLRLLADRADLTVERIAAVRNARAWRRSAANLLADWSAPGWMTRRVRDGMLLAGSVAAVTEAVRGRGLHAGWLEAVLVRPTEDHS